MANMRMDKNAMPEQAPNVRNKNFKEVALGYTPEELEEYLRQAGFREIRQYGDRTLRRPKAGAQRIFFAARKD